MSLSLLCDRKGAEVFAIDESLLALELTARNYFKVFGREENIEKRLRLIQSDYSSFSKENVHQFDLIISNPPVIPTKDWDLLEKETKLYLKRKSIDGGKYGLDKIWELIRKSGENLKMNGYLIFSSKRDQADFLLEYFNNHGDIVHNLKIDRISAEPEGNSAYFLLQKVAQKKATTIETSESDSEK